MKTAGEQRAWEALPEDLAPRLLAALRHQARAPELTYAVEPAPLGGGHWAQLYTFRLSRAPAGLSGELVLRVMPASDEEARREAAAQAAVRAAGFPAPLVHVSGGRGDGLGFPYMVMSRVAGSTPGAGMPWSEKARVPVLLAETLADLHGLDPDRFGAALAEAGWPPQTTGVEAALEGLADRTAPLALGGYADGVDWLRRNRPVAGTRVVCHGDFHPLNLMMRDGRVSGLLDWSHALLADPEYDLAYCAQLLAWWPLPARGLLKHVAGRPAAWRFVSTYRRHRPVDQGRYQWHEALHAFRLLVRVARARAGITLPPLSAGHPWERVVADASKEFQRLTAIRVLLPARR